MEDLSILIWAQGQGKVKNTLKTLSSVIIKQIYIKEAHFIIT
jgi:hypothetical protein